MRAAPVSPGSAGAQLRPRGQFAVPKHGCAPSRPSLAAAGRRAVMAAKDDGPASLTDAGTRTLLEWASKKGLKTSKIAPATFGGGLRGMIATDDVADGDVVAEVPYSAALEVVTSLRPCPFPEFIDPTFWDTAPYYVKMGLVLLREKSLGETSQFATYLKQLPKQLDTPLEWTDAQLAQLQNPALAAKVKVQRDDWKALHARAAAAALQGWQFSWQEFRWAADCARSRTFSGPYEGSDYSERINQAIFVSVLTAVFCLTGAGPLDKGLSGALSVVVFLVLKDFLIRQLPNAPKRYVMCPVVDFCNHSSGVASDLAYEYFLNSFTLTTSATKKGEQLYISYGPQPNDDLLQFYGFVERENRNDRVVVDLNSRLRETAGASGRTVAESAGLARAEVSRTGVAADVIAAAQAALGAQSAADARRAVAAALLAELGGFPTTIEADEAELAGARRRGEKLRDRDGPLEQALEYRLARKGLLRAAAAALERGANGGELGSTEGGGAAGTAAR